MVPALALALAAAYRLAITVGLADSMAAAQVVVVLPQGRRGTEETWVRGLLS